MNFTPFYYHVQDLIIKDDDKSIKKIFEDIEQQEEFKSYYEDFIHCTYPNSFKCLYYLMNEVHLRYDIHSIFTHAIKDNNIEWLDFFFEKFYSDMGNISNKTSNISSKTSNTSVTLFDHAKILAKNIFSMSMNFDYETLVNASPEMWDIMFKHYPCEIFKPHLLLNTVFDNEAYSKVYLLEELCHKYTIELPLKDILSKAFYAHDLDMAEYFISKYHPSFDKDDLTDLVSTIGLSGKPEVFQFFNQHFLPFEDFNTEQISLVFNSGLLTGKTQLTQYLKEHHYIDFYPSDKNLNNYFVQSRSTIWEDNNEQSSSSLLLLHNVNQLFDMFLWDKTTLQKEISSFTEISRLFSNLQLNNKLHDNLQQRDISSPKLKL